MPNKNNRSSEHVISVAALEYLEQCPSGEARITHVKKAIPKFIKLTEGDMEFSSTRPNERVFQQIVGNIVSHRKESSDNFIYRGLLTYRPNHLAITQAGRDYLKKIKGYEKRAL